MKGDSGVESLDAAAVALGPINRFMIYLRNNERMHVAWCVTGIVGCLLLYGVLQVCTLWDFVSPTHIMRQLGCCGGTFRAASGVGTRVYTARPVDATEEAMGLVPPCSEMTWDH